MLQDLHMEARKAGLEITMGSSKSCWVMLWRALQAPSPSLQSKLEVHSTILLWGSRYGCTARRSKSCTGSSLHQERGCRYKNKQVPGALVMVTHRGLHRGLLR